MKKIYLAGGISDTPRKNYQKKLANKIRSLGYEVYAASENDSINNKSNNPTPLNIYEGDIPQVLNSDIFVMTISGSGEDGTISEIGTVSGWNEMVTLHNSLMKDVKKIICEKILFIKDVKPIKVIAFTTNERLMEPQFYKGDKENIKGLASAGYNHLVLGMIEKWGSFVGNEEDLLRVLKEDK